MINEHFIHNSTLPVLIWPLSHISNYLTCQWRISSDIRAAHELICQQSLSHLGGSQHEHCVPWCAYGAVSGWTRCGIVVFGAGSEGGATGVGVAQAGKVKTNMKNKPTIGEIPQMLAVDCILLLCRYQNNVYFIQ